MLAFGSLHVLSVHHGEFNIHHFWLLFFCVYVCFAINAGRSSK